ncbi:phosphonate metabolism protein/1,5-bisphosphokinase (PRPP-forming) PhnN [Roseivivax isoporae]|uniref:Ribose 1,5-bisphosphate phosphokinase PhnN n=1 Tax=Roseivivax isoporae LMG 25204 TaxID=1449351 RepID=X7F6L9_9RHOB|nr:phosphonate metabolism protein/1,5-bisphosphokinase (PRPP-forming) PhnN [Roseivivax isoporae]ETX27746.1 ribose 1,5-bisphosphate phosphokinase [Roseivivax isoporae LMG 25204]
MRGGVIAVVGPSGAGKDTLMAAAAARRPGIVLVRRVVTRAPGAGGEDIEALTPEAFEARVRAGDFALHWRAHGLRYGIPAAPLDAARAGRLVLFNGSRQALGEARERLPGLRAVLVTARPEVLAARLAARGREDPADIAARLARADAGLPAGLPVAVVDNSGSVEAGIAAFLAALQPVSA